MRDNLVAVSNNDKIRVVGINLETAAARGAPRHDQRILSGLYNVYLVQR